MSTGVALAADDQDYASQPISRGWDIALNLGLTGLFAAAAFHGFSTNSRCKEARAEYARGVAAQERAATAATEVPTRPQEPRGRGAECSYDAECIDTHVCEAGWCVKYEGQP